MDLSGVHLAIVNRSGIVLGFVVISLPFTGSIVIRTAQSASFVTRTSIDTVIGGIVSWSRHRQPNANNEAIETSVVNPFASAEFVDRPIRADHSAAYLSTVNSSAIDISMTTTKLHNHDAGRPIEESSDNVGSCRRIYRSPSVPTALAMGVDDQLAPLLPVFDELDILNRHSRIIRV